MRISRVEPPPVHRPPRIAEVRWVRLADQLAPNLWRLEDVPAPESARPPAGCSTT